MGMKLCVQIIPDAQNRRERWGWGNLKVWEVTRHNAGLLALRVVALDLTVSACRTLLTAGICCFSVYQLWAPCILRIDYFRRGYFKDPKGYQWAFGIAALETEEIEQLSTLPGLSEDPSVVGLLKVEEQVPIATTTVHRRQYRTNRDSLIPIHQLIRRLESQGVISRTHLPFNSPIWPVQKSNGEWRLTVDYCGLNEVTPPLSAAVPDMLELQYELESKAAKWYATIDIANAFFSIPLAAECRPQFAFTWRGVQFT
ncbi:uncharacterized protein LOC130602657 [Pezoporus wallicus]|uniref:uncharacterized protein LOC130602657 n=1 Tax=Pezoporus wallicus TaxID=35540 RepID=UPI00254CB08D|nr:uncharacterized protein LOC130602657 [Pezoporus wallicus]